MKKLLTAFAASALLAAPAHAWVGNNGEYKIKTDRFSGTITASHDITSSNCKLTKSLKGSLQACYFLKSTENSGYSSLGFMKTNRNGWELLGYGRSGLRPALLTLKDGSVIRKQLPVVLDTSVGSGYVTEWVVVRTASIESYLPKLAHLEVQFGSAEYKWTPDAKDVCVARLAKSC